MNRATLTLLFCSWFAAPSSATSDDLMSVPNSIWSDLTLLNEQVELVKETHPDIFENTHDNNQHDRSLQLREICAIVIELFDAVAPANESRECSCNPFGRSLECSYQAVECNNKVLPTLDIKMKIGFRTTVDICQEFEEDKFERVCVEANLRDMKYDTCQKATMGYGEDITECSCTVCDEFTIQVDCTERHPLAKTEGCQRIFFEDTCLDFDPLVIEEYNMTETNNTGNGTIDVSSFGNNNITGFSRFFHGQGRSGNFDTFDNDNNFTGFANDNNAIDVSRVFVSQQQADDDDGNDDGTVGFVDADAGDDDDTMVGFAANHNVTGTPQERATNWTIADPNTNFTSTKQIQRYAMAAFYYSTTADGMEWFRSDDWLSYEVDECLWFTNTSEYPCNIHGELAILDLTENLLYGPLAPEIGYLRSLEQLYLGYNYLPGVLPTTIGSLTNLVDLDLSATDMYGTVPTELGLLTNLESLSLQYNWFSGAIPSELGLLTNAFSIELFSNDLTGSVPVEICNLIANNGTEVYIDCGVTNCTCGCMCATDVNK